MEKSYFFLHTSIDGRHYNFYSIMIRQFCMAYKFEKNCSGGMYF